MTEWNRLFERTLREHPVALSEAGSARREQMLHALMGVAAARGRRRATLRLGPAALLSAAAALACFLLPGRAVEPAVRVEIVRDDPGVLARCAPPPLPLPAEIWVDDDQLLSLLASADRRVGLVRSGSRVLLTGDAIHAN